MRRPEIHEAEAVQRKSIVYVIPLFVRMVPSFPATTDFPFEA